MFVVELEWWAVFVVITRLSEGRRGWAGELSAERGQDSCDVPDEVQLDDSLP